MTAHRRVFTALDGENHHFPIRQGYPAVKTVKSDCRQSRLYFLLGPEVDRRGPSRAHVLSCQDLCLDVPVPASQRQRQRQYPATGPRRHPHLRKNVRRTNRGDGKLTDSAGGWLCHGEQVPTAGLRCGEPKGPQPHVGPVTDPRCSHHRKSVR